jgi:hypothetical protein
VNTQGPETRQRRRGGGKQRGRGNRVRGNRGAWAFSCLVLAAPPPTFATKNRVAMPARGESVADRQPQQPQPQPLLRPCLTQVLAPSECSRPVLASLSRDSRALTRRSRRFQTFVLHLTSLLCAKPHHGHSSRPVLILSLGQFHSVLLRLLSHHQRHPASPHFRRLARLSH